MIYGNAGTSLPQKILVQVSQTALLLLGVFLTLRADGNAPRQWLLSAAFVVVYVRMTVTILVLLKRSMGWEEAISVPMAFALYYVGFALLGGGQDNPVGALEIVGGGLFVLGSTINTASEMLRDRFKKDSANKGRLYTGGLFRYSMHINYFGDILWVLGLAFITTNPWAFIIPGLLFCFFAFYNAPMLDRHLKEKYGAAFDEYASKTARIIPFLF